MRVHTTHSAVEKGSLTACYPPRAVVGRACSHVPDPLYHQPSCVHSLGGGCAVETRTAAVLRDRDATLRAL